MPRLARWRSSSTAAPAGASSSAPTIRSCSTKASRSRSSISASSLSIDGIELARPTSLVGRALAPYPIGGAGKTSVSPHFGTSTSPRPAGGGARTVRAEFFAPPPRCGNLDRGLRFNLGLYRRPEPRGSDQSVLPLIGKALPMLKKSSVALACLVLGGAIAPVHAAERED